ncbi:sugar ABC transporter permease [Bradyrhizobium sp. CCBAU 11386]|uniref:carbohydrate ABC transporter permease n=1 Tax=Bradyrhizobium sp. CCBAU 11386 TaxID=1630837 RepID=UPI0023040A71|nr:carbohydrate ABC transporter permease [Bradyrhizobium sp. CCBAU 11386]MDA9503841.1 sugar ABC transporter permease [Bradyrhizobium sp. CCBAU 11386]
MRTRLSPRVAIARHVVLFITGALIMVPCVWMVSLSLKPPAEIFQGSFSLLPKHWYVVENYAKALTAAPLAQYMVNGVIVCTTILALQILVCVPCAYALAKLEFKGRDMLFAFVVIGLLLPHQVLALPLFILGYSIGILNTYAALIFPFIVSPFGIFLFRQLFKSIPDDIVHAARLDGLSEFAIVWKIMVPMAVPAVIAFAVFSVVGHWNDLFWPLIAVREESLMPPSLGITVFADKEAGDDYGPLMAAATIVVLPLVVAFVAAQKWFVVGMTEGAIK